MIREPEAELSRPCSWPLAAGARSAARAEHAPCGTERALDAGGRPAAERQPWLCELKRAAQRRVPSSVWARGPFSSGRDAGPRDRMVSITGIIWYTTTTPAAFALLVFYWRRLVATPWLPPPQPPLCSRRPPFLASPRASGNDRALALSLPPC